MQSGHEENRYKLASNLRLYFEFCVLVTYDVIVNKLLLTLGNDVTLSISSKAGQLQGPLEEPWEFSKTI